MIDHLYCPYDLFSVPPLANLREPVSSCLYSHQQFFALSFLFPFQLSFIVSSSLSLSLSLSLSRVLSSSYAVLFISKENRRQQEKRRALIPVHSSEIKGKLPRECEEPAGIRSTDFIHFIGSQS
jgi:hypothetical protein